MYLLIRPPHLTLRVIFPALKALAFAFLAPFFLGLVFAALLCVLADFTCFRLHAAITGRPLPKGIWEF